MSNKKSVKYALFDDVIILEGGNKEGNAAGEHPKFSWPELKTETIILPKGRRKSEEYRPVICDLKYMKDTPVKMRDGITIYVDLFMPTDSDGKYPVLLVWSPFGKIEPSNNYGLYKDRALMKQKESTGFATFEGPEPDYWVSNGYIVAVADSRGATNSEGYIRQFGNEEGLDIYDTIEWLGTQSWSSGKVGMVGNSWLAMCQYHAAAQKPPHLAAIAPWEGFSDIYRDMICRGGIPAPGFAAGINNVIRVNEGIEDMAAMVEKYPFVNDYWNKEKRSRLEGIEIPAYVVASYTSFVHAYGTFRAYKSIKSGEKWLRVHNTQEWIDQQTPRYRDDLKKFYDYYLKGIENGWEETPRVRVSLLDPTGQDVTDIPKEDWPLPQTEYRRLYLDADNMALSGAPAGDEAQASYETKDRPEHMVPYSQLAYPLSELDTGEGRAEFRIRFEEDTTLCGYFKAHLYVSADAGNDMDLFMFVHKEDSMGWPYYPVVLGVDYKGAQGRLRVSHRKVENREYWDWRHEHKTEELIEPGQIVEIETVLWPLGMIWRKGETLVFTISSRELQLFEFPTPPVRTRNKGVHTIHAGGKYDSYIEVPVI